MPRVHSRSAERRLDKQKIQSGRSKILSIMDAAAISKISDALLAIHRSGYAFGDIKYGNIIIERKTKVPYFVDCECAVPLRDFSRSTSIHLRDRDCEKLNRLLGTQLPTARRLRAIHTVPGGPIYSPFYAGAGIRLGPIWRRDVGAQRWAHTLANHLPIPKGGRILDLGANNGFNALQMLRCGAGEVVGVEIDPEAIEQGLFVKRVLEWSDNRTYRFSYIRGSFSDLQTMDIGRFDLVTALCSLYYLSPELMASTIRDVATLTDIFVMQSNDDISIRRRNSRTFVKASHQFLAELAGANGFPHVTVIGRPGLRRPLIIARTNAATNPCPSCSSAPVRPVMRRQREAILSSRGS
ncbi:MAG TPA: class I SAM-dependent methyltransferase [Pseudolabrys sp.]|nr:class I SAM-dependent methyltransferase [Pseudolabrys sp.]